MRSPFIKLLRRRRCIKKHVKSETVVKLPKNGTSFGQNGKKVQTQKNDKARLNTFCKVGIFVTSTSLNEFCRK